MSTKNTNKLNVPQARAAMDKFKMEAARGGCVSTSKSSRSTGSLFTISIRLHLA